MKKHNKANPFKSGVMGLKRAACGAVAIVMAASTMTTVAFATSRNGFDASMNANSSSATTAEALQNHDIIDYTKTARLTIHKYDQTAALRGGVDIRKLNKTDGNNDTEYDRPDGLRDTNAEEKLKPYALQGVQFTAVRVGDIATLSTADNTDRNGRVGGNIEVVYSIPNTLRDKLGLHATDGTAATNARHIVGTKCYYTGRQLQDALRKLIDSANTDYGPNADINGEGHLGKTTKQNTYGKDSLIEWLHSSNDIPEGQRKTGTTNENGEITWERMDLGNYLVIETRVPDNVNTTTNPFFVSLPMTSKDGDSWEGMTTENGITFYDAHVYPKNQTNDPIVDKTVHEESDNEFHDEVTASTGDILDYRVVIKMPTITSYETSLSQLEFDDILSKGLSYNTPFQIDFYETEEEARNPILYPTTQNDGKLLGTWKQNDRTPKFTVTTEGDATKTDGTHAKIVVTKAGLQEINNSKTDSTIGSDANVLGTEREDGRTKYSDKWMVLSYKVKVEEMDQLTLGDDGNPNQVTVSYKRRSEPGNPSNDPKDPHPFDPNSPPTTVTDMTPVYSYGINLKKMFDDAADENDKGNPRNVKFVLYNKTDGYYVVADPATNNGNVVNGKYFVNNAQKGYKTDGDGKPVLDAQGKTQPDRTKATVFVPDEDGNLFLNGLEADDYGLIETDTDSGYVLLREEVDINIKPTRKEIQANVAQVTGNPDVTYILDGNGNIQYDENSNPLVQWSDGTTEPSGNQSGQHPVPSVPAGDALVENGGTSNDHAGAQNVPHAQPIKPARVTLLESASATVDGADAVMEKLLPKNDADNHESENARVMMSVMNSRGFDLPSTGGAGVWALTMTGVFGVAGAAYVLVRKSKIGNGTEVDETSGK